MKQQIKFCHTSDGIRIAYAISGTGPPLVKAANWLSHIEYECQNPIWWHWYEDLSQYYTLIRYDQRGCGLSDRNIKTLTFDSWIKDMEAVIKATDLNQFPLLGISQGGAVAIAYAEKYPEKVSKLILYGSYARGRMQRGLTEKQVEETELLIQLIKMGWSSENPAFRQVFTSLFIPDATLDQIRWLNDLHKHSTSAENAIKIVKVFDEIDVSDLSAKIQIPSIVLHAKGDQRVPFEEGRIIASLIPDAQFIPLDSNNHILLESEPAWQLFLTTVLNFISTESSIFSSLTKRECEVLDLIARGITNSEIADNLFISPKTVRNDPPPILWSSS